MSDKSEIDIDETPHPEEKNKIEPHPTDIDPTGNRQQEILAILERANHIGIMTSLDDLLEQMLVLMIDASGASNGALYLLDHQSGELVFTVAVGDEESKDLVGMPIKEAVGILDAAVQRAQPIVIDDLASDPRWNREISPETTAHLRNAITLPLLIKDKPIGAVQIFNFSQAELEILLVLGNRMASEVDKVQLLNKSQRSNLRLQILVDILGQIGAVLDRDQLLDLLTEHASLLLDAESSRVLLVDRSNKEDQDHILSAISSVAAPLRARPISVGKERSRLAERVIGNLMVINKKSGRFDEEDTQLLGILASQASTVLQIAELYKESNILFLDFIEVLAATIDAKYPYTHGHSQRVSKYSVAIAEELGLDGDQIHDIRIGSLLHDIGIIGVPDIILTKPTSLTEKEFQQIKEHPRIGLTIINQVGMLGNVLPAIFQHHERLDGSGYPLGLEGEQISLMGRIVAVADVYDALNTDRPYRKAMDRESIFDYLQKNTGVLFDGYCVSALISSELK